jgi:hypothetical protein
MQATNAKESSAKLLEKLEKDKNLLEIKYNEMNKNSKQQKDTNS